MALVRDGRAARHIGPLFADTPQTRAGAGRRDRAVRSRPMADRRGLFAGRISQGSHRRRLEHRAAVSAHAVRPRRHARRRTAVRGRRPRIWIGTAPCIIARSSPRCGKLIADGTVIPAHPLALDASRKLDIRHQRALSRYYIDAGAGGLAVGVHTTQFAIREAGLYRPVLELAAETASAWTKRPLAMVAGLVGPTQQAIAEARTARGIGYHAGLLSLAAMKSASEDEIIAPLRGGGARDSAGRLLSAAGGRRRDPQRGFLAAFCGDRQRHRHQGRAVQPLSHARRAARHRRRRRARPRRALYRQ